MVHDSPSPHPVLPTPPGRPACAGGHPRGAIEALEGAWDEALVRSWTRHLTQPGRLVLSGMASPAWWPQKIAATLASTGCPSFYLHPADALHGDLGMVMADDTVLILSNSGESEGSLRLLPSPIRTGVKIGAITVPGGQPPGARRPLVLHLRPPEGEGCPLNFAPMASTTLQLVWGDLLAAHHMVESGFTLEHFAEFHPGRQPRRPAAESPGPKSCTGVPQVAPETDPGGSPGAMTQGKLGMAVVMDGGPGRG